MESGTQEPVVLVGSHDTAQGSEGCQADRVWSPEEGMSAEVIVVKSGSIGASLAMVRRW